jgi:HSP20 family protein
VAAPRIIFHAAGGPVALEEEPQGFRAKEDAMNTLNRWRPFPEMDDFFKPFFRRMPAMPAEFSKEMEWSPATDVSETPTEYLVKADLPGVRKDDVQILVDSGMLTVKGERRMEHVVSEQKMHRSEVFYGTFERSFALPENVDPAHIKADYKDGVLFVHLPKVAVEATKPVKIAVQ